MGDNKSLQVVKENAFTKVINFIRSIFYKNTQEKIEELNLESYVSDSFDSSIKVDIKDKAQVIINQEKFEKEEIDLSELSDKEVHELSILYQKQVMELESILSDKLAELSKLKKLRMENN